VPDKGKTIAAGNEGMCPRPNRVLIISMFLLAVTRIAQSQEATPSEENLGARFQATIVTQAHPSFDAPYSGTNSLHPASEHESTVTATLFLGARLWKGAEGYVNPELSGGSGLSQGFGIAGFPNGEAFRVGNPEPHIFLARLFLRQTFGIGAQAEALESDENQLAGTRATNRFVVTVGKFGLSDFIDDNAYGHDPRTGFMNWADWTEGAWDYPADTRGYTWGIVVERIAPQWAVRAAAAMEPKEANQLEMDHDVRNAHGLALEGEHAYRLLPAEGRVRLLLFLNRARMGNYRQAIDETTPPDLVATRKPGRTKWGFGTNIEQPVTEKSGLLVRASWNDGENESWAYAEIDRSISAGYVDRPGWWKRDKDEAGIAAIVNGISAAHRDYLAAGGYGFMIGDGKLKYGTEQIVEAYAKAVFRSVSATLDYQFIRNPAYNRDRGPVHVFGFRLHVEVG
jgi:high affinity Mn2+ porin